MQTVVIGHRNPDMDAICSALAYAELLRLQGREGVVAGRCGATNERIDYALGRFGFDPPFFFPDVRPRVADVMQREVVTAGLDEPVYAALARLGERRFRGLPVVDSAGRCAGLLSSYKISRHVFPLPLSASNPREVRCSLEAIRGTLGADVAAGTMDAEVLAHVLVVVAMQTDSFQRRLGALDVSRTVLIVGDRRNIQRLAIEAGVRAIILTGGARLDPELKDMAEERGTRVLESSHDTATTVLLCRSAVRAGDLINAEFEALEPGMTLQEARRRVALLPQFAFPVLDEERRLAGILSKSDFLKPAPRQLVLVDHNELAQAVPGAAEAPIIAILDHHRLGPPPTTQPILFLNRPVGSTCSIVADCFEREGIPIPPQVAGLLMCGLIADTLNLTSPTTTDFDRELMPRLAARAEVRPEDLAAEIFAVGSPLRTMTAARAVEADCKEYEEGGRRFSVSQIEELSFTHLEDRRAELLEALEAFRAARGLDFSALLVTDVNTQNSILLLRGPGSLERLVDYPTDGAHAWRLDGVVSRKKQLLPYLLGLLAHWAGEEAG